MGREHRSQRWSRLWICLLGGLMAPAAGLAPPPAAANPAEPSAAPTAAQAVVQARSALRNRSSASTAATAASDGRLVTITDPADGSDPRADIFAVSVIASGDALVFSMEVAEHTDPATDPAWAGGGAAALWVLDTSGDDDPDLSVELFNVNGQVQAQLVDLATDVIICQGIPGAHPESRSYTVGFATPGCFGDVRRPSVFGVLFFGGARPDFAPDEPGSVRFERQPLDQPTGGYAVVSSDARYRRFGSTLIGGGLLGAFEDYVGPAPVVSTASARAYEPALWSVTSAGEVSTVGGAEWWGDLVDLGVQPVRPIVGMAVVPDGSGYWLVASDGGIFAFGSAGFYGSTGGIALNRPVVGMAASVTGDGYWLVASDGGIFAFGSVPFHGSTGGIPLQKPVVGMSAGIDGQGYWLVAADGGIFAFGVPFYGSTGSIALQQPVVGMATTRSGGGYRFVGRDGGIFSFGDAEFNGSAASAGRTDVVGLATA